jgi:hypothetical protein
VFGVQAYVGDFFGNMLLGMNMFSSAKKYCVGREETLRITNLARIQNCRKVKVYNQMGISSGMQTAIDAARQHNIPVEYCQIPDDMMRHVVGKSLASTVVWSASMAPYAITSVALVRGMYRLARRVV